MHSLIGIIVYTNDKDEALKKAKEIMEEQLEYKHFDWYQTFDEDGHRFGEMPTALNAETREGLNFIECLMGYTMKNFMESLSAVRKVLAKKTDFEIWESRHDKEMIRHRFYELGSYGGHMIHLYDNDGEGIQERGHLKSVLDKWTSLPESHEKYKELNVYVVPVDAHS